MSYISGSHILGSHLGLCIYFGPSVQQQLDHVAVAPF